MKTIIFIAVIAFVTAHRQYYDLEKLDINHSIHNTNELKIFVDCVLEKGECSKVYGSYKEITAEAVKQACKRCSSYQKHVYWLFLEAMKANLPNEYVCYRNKFDPKNKYFDALEAELKKFSIAY